VTPAPHALADSVTPPARPTPAATSLGLLGGGQLGRMFVHAAQVHGFAVTVLEPDAHSPAGAAANTHVRADYTDPAALATLASTCVAVTTEFENVPAHVLRVLANTLPVSPPASAVEICQHRALEKQCFVQAGVPCAPHALIETAAHAAAPALANLLPGLLKTARLGYDGKGQVPVNTLADVSAAWTALGSVACVLEKKLPLQLEISVIVARGRDGVCVHLPVQQNLHRAGVLAVTQVPAPDLPAATAMQAIQCALQLAQSLHYVGVLCVEFFVLIDGSLVANEMAPRPHNSGHYSINACDVSQFDLQLRTLVGWPLAPPRQHSAAVMLNLLGDLWFARTDVATEPDWPSVLNLPGVHLHLYGKAQARRGRKMGHLTVTAPDAGAARHTASQVAARLGLPPL
jgi:5-(carboxyamino)imidazole ribonucleotide synthase